MNDKHWSEGVAYWAVKYSAKLTYAEATNALLELAQIDISENSVWRLTQHWGEKLNEVEEQEDERANTIVESQVTGKVETKSDPRLGAAMDGTMIYIRGEAWKELKVGCFFEVKQAPTLDVETTDWIDLAHAHKITYVSHLGGPEPFGQKMWTEAKRRQWHSAVDTQVVGDGAPWIWNLVRDYFYDAHQVVDWYHATEHLATASHLAFGEGTPEAKRWFNQQKTPLFQGHADQIAQTILTLADQPPETNEKLKDQAGYFTHNLHRMQYLEMRSDGWLIGSGAVESGGGRFKDRFAQAGMRWSRIGAERLLPVRAAYMSNQFDARWRSAYNSPPN